MSDALTAVTPFVQLPFVAGLFSLLLAGISVVRRQPSVATWCFFAGMIALGIDSILAGFTLRATTLDEVVQWMSVSSLADCFIPVIWLGFSLTYSRRSYREYLQRWRLVLVIVALLPVGIWLTFRDQLFAAIPDPAAPDVWRLHFGQASILLNGILLFALVSILVNLEQTFRSAVGTMRWRIKYVVLALALIFGARLYVSSQAILYSAPAIAQGGIKAGALLIGCVFLTLAYTRTGWREIDVHPSSAILRSSLTVMIVGGYLFAVGVLAVLVKRFGGAEVFQLQALVVLLGMAGLALLVLSDRARQRLNQFAARHFKKAQHDSVRIWTLFSQNLAKVTDQAGLATVSAKLISEAFDVLSVTLWLLDEENGHLVVADSTGTGKPVGGSVASLSTAVIAGLQSKTLPFDLENLDESWAEEIRLANPTTFPNGGNRLGVPLVAGSRLVGVMILADRINGVTYTVEELELLRCIADQMTSVLLNIRFAGELAQARELEAFRTMSAFFVHDLKNAAASLNLMLRNLPVHFDDPAFRRDALRAIGNTAQRIDNMITRLSEFRDPSNAVRVDTDLNQLVTAALESVTDTPGIEVVRELQPLPAIRADREQLQSVVTNLILNARDAVGASGRIEVSTKRQASRVVLSVVDNGCGMSPAFIRESLFRPFQSTKNKGLGLGMFQSRTIVVAHGGTVQVESEVGKGTSIRASFPVDAAR